LEVYFSAAHPLQIVAWAADEYLTFNFNPSKIESLPPMLDYVFRDLYGLGEGYSVSFSIL
jgi:hypothetical protein